MLGDFRMKVFLKSLLWSTGLELVLVVPILVANYIHLGALDAVPGVLAYLALFCHAPAFYLLRHWPAAQGTLTIPVLVQWLIWFIAFLMIFALRRLFRNRRLDHEKHAA
jgi:hypothetical protein